MSKELNIIEVLNSNVRTEYEATTPKGHKYNCVVVLDEGNKVLINSKNGTKIDFLNDFIINTKFIPIQKPVSFEEAICSNKRIKVVVPKELNYKYSNGITCLLNDSWNNEYETVGEILKMLARHEKREVLIKECKWYIEEE